MLLHRLAISAAVSLVVTAGLSVRAEATPAICGFCFYDNNGNGVQDFGEYGVSDWEICVTLADGTESCKWTDEDGAACWFFVPEGTYEVCETLVSGWTNTSPLCLDLTLGHNVGEAWFGNQPSGGSMTSDVNEPNVRSMIVLSQNVPNPVRTSTVITYSVPASARARLEIVDAGGRVIRAFTRDQESAGTSVLEWDRTDESGQRVPTGLYFYRLFAAGEVTSRKMIVLP